MSGGMITADVSGKAEVVLSTKGDIATWDTARVRKGVSATNYTGLQADSAIADGLTYGATARSTMTGTADMIYSSGANTLSRLAVGSARQVLQTNSATNALEWSNSPQSLMGTTGDILSTSSANTLSAISPTTSGNVLTSNGAGVLPTFQTAGGGNASTVFTAISDASFTSSATSFVAITGMTHDIPNITSGKCYNNFTIGIIAGSGAYALRVRMVDGDGDTEMTVLCLDPNPAGYGNACVLNAINDADGQDVYCEFQQDAGALSTLAMNSGSFGTLSAFAV